MDFTPPPSSNTIQRTWKFALNASPEKVWPFLADTSTFNQYLNLPAIEYTETDGQLTGKALYGPVLHEWREMDWEWEYPLYFKNQRDFTRGWFQQIQGVYHLTAQSETQTEVLVSFTMHMKNFWGRWLAFWALNWLRKRYEHAFQHIQDCLGQHRHCMQPNPALPEVNQPILAEKIQQLSHKIANQPLLHRLERTIQQAADESLDRLRVLRLARKWEVQPRELLTLFLEATRVGLLEMSWDLICTHCRGDRNRVLNLWEVPGRFYCDVCQIEFDTTSIDAMEVSFRPQSSVRKVQPKQYCSAQPSRQPHIHWQKLLSAGQSLQHPLKLQEQRYRLRIKGNPSLDWIVCCESEFTNHLNWNLQPSNQTYQTNCRFTLNLSNTTDKDVLVTLDADPNEQDVLRPVDLFTFQRFRDLFAEQALSSGLRLDVGERAILFTDIVGSTDLYQRLGDDGAFAAVKNSFSLVAEQVQKQEGAVVKTIGDAVMAVFNHPRQALQAALAMIQPKAQESSPLQIRVSFNFGRCLVVSLNTGMDFFGNTVNLAAKLQNLSKANEVVFPQGLLAEKELDSMVEGRGLKVQYLEFKQGGDAEPIKVVHLGHR